MMDRLKNDKPTHIQATDEFGKPFLLFGLPVFMEVVDGDVEKSKEAIREMVPPSELLN